MLRFLVMGLLVLAVRYFAIAFGLYAIQRRMLFPADTTRPDLARVGLAPLREVTLVTADGLHLLAWYLPPPPDRPVLAYFHGRGGNLSTRAERVRMFAAARYGLLMVEYRGYGGNAGHPSETGLATDARAAMEFLAAEGFGADRLVVYGKSIGTGVATRVASEQTVAALVLESPYTSIRAIAARRYFFLPVRWLLRDPFDCLSRIGRVRAPILMLQGDRDTVIPPGLGRDLFEAAPEPKQIWAEPDGRHENLMDVGAGQVVIDFIDRWLPGQGVERLADGLR